MLKRRLQHPGLNAHRMVAELAVEMAEALFEVYAQDNALYRRMHADGEVTKRDARRHFVTRVAPRMLEDARSALVDLISAPNTTEHVKAQIYEALLLDSDLRGNRVVALESATVPTRLH